MTALNRDPDGELAQGTLWEATCAAVRRGLRTGALEPLTTRVAAVPEAGIPFSVRVLAGLERKIERTREQRRAGRNPFLPHDPDLFVSGLSDSHRVVLNKYPVLDHHLLLVTRRFERQEAALDRDDLDAALRGLAEFPSLAFYNGGRAAGASQRHKHLQLVALPLGAHGEDLPIEVAFRGAGHSPILPFRHAFAPVPAAWWHEPSRRDRAAEESLALYHELLAATDSTTTGDPRPYNWLLSRRFMWVVPRSRGSWEGIPANALAYAGALFARGEAQHERIRQAGPLRILREAGHPW